MRVDCACTVAALGPDESSRVDLVTRDLDVYRINAVVESLRQDLELVEVRKSLELGEARQASPECAKESSEPLRSGERWLVPEMLPEVDMSSRSRVPEFMVT